MKSIESQREDQKEAAPYNPEEWEQMKSEALVKGSLLHAFREGREIGVPEEELDALTDRVIANEERLGNWKNAFICRSRLGKGTPEELITIGERALRKAEEENDRSAGVNEIRRTLQELKAAKETDGESVSKSAA